MDNDPNTRIAIGSVSKKARKATRQNRTPDTQSTRKSLQFTTQHEHHQAQQPISMKTTRQDYQHDQVQQPPQRQMTEIGPPAMQRDQVRVSNDARQFANTRYPFSPFGITLADDVRDKVIVEHLVKVAKDKFDFTLEIAGYRRTKVNEGFEVLIFVKTVNSFTYLLDKKMWPSELVGKTYSLALPNIPPQLSLVLPFVPYKTDMQELLADIKSMHPEVVNVIRLKNRQQQMIKAVKLELNSDNVRKQILDSKKLLVGGISYQVEEYMAQAHVLVCSQCMGIGHFRKNCPQQQMHTCNVCGDISADIQLHKQDCTGISKCIHCGGDHRSNDTKCPRIKDYRSALTKSLLTNRPVPQATTTLVPRLLSTTEFPTLGLAHVSIIDKQDYPRNQEQGSVGKIDRVLEKLEIIQKQMTSFTIFIDEKNKKDEIVQNKIHQIESRTSSMNEDLSATQTILIQLLDLLKSMTVNPNKATEDEVTNRLNMHRTTLLNLLMKTVPCTDNSIFMILSPNTSEFFPRNPTSQNTCNLFLSNVQPTLSSSDFNLLCTVVQEWHDKPTLASCLTSWKKFTRNDTKDSFSHLHVLCFNVRGLDRRWNEVVLLCSIYSPHVLVLVEVGQIDHSLIAASFATFRSFYQPGENNHGGVIMFVRQGITASRYKCPTPNVCVLDTHGENTVRIIGMYAPQSKSWNWSDLTQLISDDCVILGDFNVDLEIDQSKAENLLNWAEGASLVPILPSEPTSLRSQRTIDYALARGVHTTVQTHEGYTTSDHKPILCTLSCERREDMTAKRTNWTIFTAMLSYTFSYWEQQWALDRYEETYGQFVEYLAMLAARCIRYFPLQKARLALPRGLVTAVAKSRALSFRAKRTSDATTKEEASRLRNQTRAEIKKFRYDQMVKALEERHQPQEGTSPFWSRTRKHFKDSSSALRGIILSSGHPTRDPQEMAIASAQHYQQLFEEPVVYRPHPYVDAPPISWENHDASIPPVTYPEILQVLAKRKKKMSCDAHRISPVLLEHMPKQYWHLLLRLYNCSLTTAFMPTKWKNVRMIILAKKDSICRPADTRPISLLDSFLKVLERLFLNRFSEILANRGILPDSQSGFRPKHRLQTRVLLFIEQMGSLMANSSPVATALVDFRSAFDQLWFAGCVGKLKLLGIPLAFTQWIEVWLSNRRAFIEIAGKRSDWFPIKRGGPQGSSLTPSIFICYHSDMGDALSMATCSFFADDLAAPMAGRIGIRFTEQCIDVERRLRSFFVNLEAYAVLSVQPINYDKTKALWSARAISPPNPMPKLTCGGHSIEWTREYKYLGYLISPKLGWTKLITKSLIGIRRRTTLINQCKFAGASSPKLRRVLFTAYVFPLFSWLFALYPLFTENQRASLRHQYMVCLKRINHCLQWEDFIFSALFREPSLDYHATNYWRKYLRTLPNSSDGRMLLEQDPGAFQRTAWLDGELKISGLRRSKRFVQHPSIISRCILWYEENTYTNGTGTHNASTPHFTDEELETLAQFPDTF